MQQLDLALIDYELETGRKPRGDSRDVSIGRNVLSCRDGLDYLHLRINATSFVGTIWSLSNFSITTSEIEVFSSCVDNFLRSHELTN